jgi:hypothetical protein
LLENFRDPIISAIIITPMLLAGVIVNQGTAN